MSAKRNIAIQRALTPMQYVIDYFITGLGYSALFAGIIALAAAWLFFHSERQSHPHH